MKSPTFQASTVSLAAHKCPSITAIVSWEGSNRNVSNYCRRYGSKDQHVRWERLCVVSVWTQHTNRTIASLWRTPRCEINFQKPRRQTIRRFAHNKGFDQAARPVAGRDRFDEEITHLQPHPSTWSTCQPSGREILQWKRRMLNSWERTGNTRIDNGFKTLRLPHPEDLCSSNQTTGPN